MRLLVTGGSGFVGVHFVRRALDRGHETILLRRRAAVTESVITADLASGEGLDRVPWETFDAVVHLAAAGVKASDRRWPECVRVNVVGTQRLLNAISRAKAKPVLWIAQTLYESVTADFPALLENPYIATKASASALAREWAVHWNLPLIFGRIFQAYGPGDDPGNVLTYAAHCIRHGELARFGTGASSRDWIYIDDVADGIVTSLELTKSGVQTFDLGSGKTSPIRAVIERMACIAGVPSSLLSFDPGRDRDDQAIEVRATTLPPGWHPKVGLDEGLGRLLNAVVLK